MTYREMVTNDIYTALMDDPALLEGFTAEDFKTDTDTIANHLEEIFWIDDAVTGNGSGSYTFDRNRAKEYVMEDTETVMEALREFCTDAETIAEKFLNEEWEWLDVSARCYVLSDCIIEVLDEIAEAIEELETEDITEAIRKAA